MRHLFHATGHLFHNGALYYRPKESLVVTMRYFDISVQYKLVKCKCHKKWNLSQQELIEEKSRAKKIVTELMENYLGLEKTACIRVCSKKYKEYIQEDYLKMYIRKVYDIFFLNYGTNACHNQLNQNDVMYSAR